MDILSLFNREEKVAGLEISDNCLRLSLLSFNKERFTQEVGFAVEESLPAQTVQKGIVVDDKSFMAALTNLLNKQGKKKISYVIFSLPSDQVFTKIYSFPKTIEHNKLKESQKLITDYQLPFKASDIYFDWEEVKNPDKKEFLLAAISRAIVDKYVQLLFKSGLRTVAVEFHPISLLRSLALPESGQFLINQDNPNATYVYLTRDKKLRYLRVLPREFMGSEKVPEEIKRIGNFFEAENGKLQGSLELAKSKVAEKYRSPLLDNENKWAISLGAAIRGALPRSEDKLISLMPIGTEKAYEYQRAMTFTKFIYALTLTLSIFFLVVYIGSWLLMLSIQQQKSNQIENLSATQIPPETAGLETRMQKLNALTQLTVQLVNLTPRFSKLLEETKKRVPTDVKITSMALSSLQGDITMVGIAANRTALNQIKKNLEDSPLLKDISLPLTNLEQRENIPFSLTFKLEDLNSLYTQ